MGPLPPYAAPLTAYPGGKDGILAGLCQQGPLSSSNSWQRAQHSSSASEEVLAGYEGSGTTELSTQGRSLTFHVPIPLLKPLRC